MCTNISFFDAEVDWEISVAGSTHSESGHTQGAGSRAHRDQCGDQAKAFSPVFEFDLTNPHVCAVAMKTCGFLLD